MRILIPALAILLMACSPERRLQRLVDRNPSLRDTVRVHLVDTVVFPPDTLERLVLLRDTVTVESERQVVRVVRVPTGSPCDTAAVLLDLQAVIRPDTVIVTNTVEVPRIVCPEGRRVASWWRTAALVLALILAAHIYLRR